MDNRIQVDSFGISGRPTTYARVLFSDVAIRRYKFLEPLTFDYLYRTYREIMRGFKTEGGWRSMTLKECARIAQAPTKHRLGGDIRKFVALGRIKDVELLRRLLSKETDEIMARWTRTRIETLETRARRRA